MFRDEEVQHRALYEAHWLLVAAAAKIHDVAVACHAASRHSDTRAKLSALVVELDKARDAADLAWTTAAKARSEMIRLTGCDGSCHEGLSDIIARTAAQRTDDAKTE